MKQLFRLSLFLLFFASCSKDEPSIPNGDVTLSSRFYGTTVYYVNGWSFELEEVIPTLNSGGRLFDIVPENILEPSGKVIGAQFSVEGSNPNGILLNDEFESLTAAEDYFNNYKEAVNGPWTDLSDTLRPYQVFTYKTHQNNFVKFLVKDVRIMDGVQESDYVEIDIHYYIQRDGSPFFDE